MKLKRKKKKNPSEPKQKQKTDKGIYQSDTNDMDDLFGISNAPSVQEDSSGQIDRSKLVKKVQNQLSIKMKQKNANNHSLFHRSVYHRRVSVLLHFPKNFTRRVFV